MSFSIEFVGLPGVGKSTLSHRTAAILSSDQSGVSEPIRRIDDRSSPYRVVSKGRFAAEHAFRHPRTTLSATQNLLKTDQASAADLVSVAFNLHYVAGVVVHARRTSDVTLLDQGPYQSIWSVGLRSATDWESLLDHFDAFLSRTAPGLVVLVEAKEKTITDRLRSRKNGDTRFAPETPTFDRGVQGYRSLKNKIQSSDAVGSIVVENETPKDLESGAHQIAKTVSSLQN